ncbi:MAG: hypothetical protein K8S56_08685 [Candidatus Cloacimonetes bacterium]|nr:hypothetical protein [Candidatus Cloacimonadota bacterium]
MSLSSWSANIKGSASIGDNEFDGTTESEEINKIASTRSDYYSSEKNYTTNNEDFFSKEFSYRLYLDGDKSYYLSDSGLYFGFGGEMRINHRYSDRDDESYREIENLSFTEAGELDKESSSERRTNSESIQKILDIMLFPSITFGYGRNEYLHDARLAVYIFQSLEDHNLLTSLPDDETILEFASLITKIKNERIIDYRELAIYEFETLMNFLSEKEIVVKNNVKTAALVYDNWKYLRNSDGKTYYGKPYSIVSRRCGNKIYLKSELLFKRAYSVRETDTEEKYYYFSNDIYSVQIDSTFNTEKLRNDFESEEIGFSIELTDMYSKPLGLDWQLNMDIGLEYCYINYEQEKDEIDEKLTYEYDYYENIPNESSSNDTTYTTKVENSDTDNDYSMNLELFFSSSIIYAYNFRTIFTGFVNGTYFTKSQDINDLLQVNVDSISDMTEIGISGQYWVSPKLIFNGIIAYNHSFGKNSSPCFDYKKRTSDYRTISYDDSNIDTSTSETEKSSSWRIHLELKYTIF